MLALVRFGHGALPAAGTPLTIDVQLMPLGASPPAELWLANGTAHVGQLDAVRYAHDEQLLFGVVELDERAHGGVRGASEAAYRSIRQFQLQCGFPHLLRMWNYLDAINDGPGDLERYRQFCAGRAHGLEQAPGPLCPAATAVGRQHLTHQLQVLWLASRSAGTPIENPRQVSAYRYPRAHGPISPSFSRATLTHDSALLISGTASIVGHASCHHGDVCEQLAETLRNLSALVARVPEHGAQPAAVNLLKVYLRDPALLEPVAARLARAYPGSDTIFLAADICRRELLVEIEAVRTRSG